MAKPPHLLVAHAEADRWSAELEARFPGLGYTIVRSPEELAASAGTADVAYSCVTDTFPRAAHGTLRYRPGLAWIHVGGSGFDHLAGAGGPTPLLTNGAGVLAPFLAETLLAAMLALGRGLHSAVHAQLAGRWAPWTFVPLAGQTLAVVGTGAIGTALARRARALGLRVIGVARQPAPREAFDEVRPLHELVEVAAACDFLSLNVRLVQATRHLVDARVLAAMRPSAFLLNAARGAVVDEPALVDALRERRIAGAYLDVFATEPLPAASPLWRLDNVLMTPHMSDRVADWELRHARFFMDNLARWIAGEPLVNVVSG
jgi:phosphoglycerate dehydrogenase-like enzyme